MRIRAHAVIQWRQNAADGAGVDPAISVPADSPIHRTSIQASTTPNAVQTLSKRRSKDSGPAIVQDDEMKFFRSVQLAGLSRAGDERRVDRQRLTSSSP